MDRGWRVVIWGLVERWFGYWIVYRFLIVVDFIVVEYFYVGWFVVVVGLCLMLFLLNRVDF